MKSWFERLLMTYGYDTIGEFGSSVAPAFKYAGWTTFTAVVSAMSVSVNRIFGLDAYAFIALVLVMLVELVSGITASHVRRDSVSSTKLSRFTLKSGCYLILIAVPYLFSASFKFHGKDVSAVAFDWMHQFFVIQIVLENFVSILENMAVISGKPKTHIINKLTSKIENLFN